MLTIYGNIKPAIHVVSEILARVDVYKLFYENKRKTLYRRLLLMQLFILLSVYTNTIELILILIDTVDLLITNCRICLDVILCVLLSCQCYMFLLHIVI